MTRPTPGFSVAALITALAACSSPIEQPTEWHQGNGVRWREVVPVGAGRVGFTHLRSSKTGIDFANRLTEDEAHANQMRANGSGVALGDVDGDGRLDVYLARLSGPNALYRNLGGWRFEDVTERAGLEAPDRFSTGVTFADVDGDGDLDLLAAAVGGPNALFLNDGTGRFREVTAESGLSSELGSMTLALADVDGDADLDVYVANYKTIGLLDLYPPQDRTFERTVDVEGGSYDLMPEFREHYRLSWEGMELKRLEIAEPDAFYLNDGTGRFEQVEFTSGRFLDDSGRPLQEPPKEWALAASFRDVDGDGDPDLYVCNDLFSPDHFWINDGSGHFRAAGPAVLRTTSASSMAVDFSDIDLDGDLDFFTADMLGRESRRRKTQIPAHAVRPTLPGEVEARPQVPRNALQLNRGDGSFAEIGRVSGVAGSDWSWSSLFLDVDLDGDEDLLISNGHLWDLLDGDSEAIVQNSFIVDWRRVKSLYPPLRSRNVLFRNNGDLTFDEVGEEWGFAGEPDISHGMATGDLDGDGDQDVVINRLGDPVLVLRNDTAAPRIAVRLRGDSPNTGGVGAKIRVLRGAVPVQVKEVVSGGAYLSGPEMSYSFAAGESNSMTIVVDWRSGRRSVIEGVGPNRLYEIDEAGAAVLDEAGAVGDPRPSREGAGRLFRDVTAVLNHQHLESVHNDFRLQPLLPQRFSQLGPGMTWADLDEDEDPDLLIGTGRGGRLSLLRNEGDRFVQVVVRMPEAALDQTTVLPFPGEPGAATVLVGQSNQEAPNAETAGRSASVLRLELAATDLSAAEVRPTTSAAVEGAPSGTGPLALADYDADGDLDLFVGGRLIPSLYPAPATSRLYRNENGRLRLDRANGTVLESIGLVSAGVFSDVDADGDPDLLLALDWGPLKLLRNDGGRFTEADVRGLSAIRNRWNGVTTGDLNGDGRLDILATAWGRNTKYALYGGGPLRLYYGDFDNDGMMDLVEASPDARLGDYSPIPSYRRLATGLGFVRSRIRTYTEYAEADVGDLLGPAAGGARFVEADRLEHFVFLNRDGGFDPIPLPFEAQLAPAFHVGVYDLDGDGFEDVFLAQNFYATEPETARYDSGRGLMLRGDGTGGLEPVPAQTSGLEIYGDQRGAAFADYDRDGRIDLAVSQNGAATKLFHNEGAAPGLRVRLIGPPGNPRAIGAAVRVVYEEGFGPLREIKAGSGYWSMDDPVQILGLASEPRAVWIRWPGGAELETPTDSGVREVEAVWTGAGP